MAPARLRGGLHRAGARLTLPAREVGAVVGHVSGQRCASAASLTARSGGSRTRAWLHHRQALRAQRARLWLIGRQPHRQQRVERHVEPVVAAAAIDDRAGRHDRRRRRAFATSMVSRVEPPVVTTSSTTSTLSAGLEREAAAQRQRAVLALGEDRAARRARGATSWPMTMPPSAGDRTSVAPNSATASASAAPERLGVARAAAAPARTADSRDCAGRTTA